MKFTFAAAIGLVLASAGAAGAQSYYGGPTPAYASAAVYASAGAGYVPCAVGWHLAGALCICDTPANFYPGGGVYPGGYGDGGGYGGGGYGGGYNVHVGAPGVRVIGQPVSVASGVVYIDGPPVYVQAPPVHVDSPQIYVQRPQVVVQPSQVTVDPPIVHVEPCPEGTTCEMAGQSTPPPAPAHYRSPRR